MDRDDEATEWRRALAPQPKRALSRPRRASLYRYALVVGLVILACIVALSLVGTSAPNLRYEPGGSSIQ
jgi:hypothetical protein